MHREVPRLLVAGLMVLLAWPGAAQAVPFQNGGFETPAIADATAYGLGNSNYAAPWVSTTSDNSRGYTQNYLFADNYAGFHPSEGRQAILLNSDGYVTVTLSQTFDTVPGTIYAAAFDLGREPGSVTTPPTVVVQAAGGTALTYSATTAAFIRQTYAFVATGNISTLTFTQSSGPGLSPILDNVAVQPAAFGPFQNGGFEDPIFPSGIQYGLGTSAYLTGWVSTTNNTSPGNWWLQNYLYNPGFDKVAEGNQAVMLNGDGQATTTLSQTFATVGGTEYLVTFDLGHQGADTGNPATIVVEATGNSPVTYAADSVSFVVRSYSFTAAGPVTTLTFSQSTGPADYSPELDNVIVQSLAPIPEPATLTLLALGACGLLARRRRR